MSAQPFIIWISAPAVNTARSDAGLAPPTVKLAIGASPRNVAFACGAGCQSCAQAARPKTLSNVLPVTKNPLLAQLPSSLRVTVLVREAYDKANSAEPEPELSL